jgi:hypothetical protein
MLHQVGDLFELNLKLRYQMVQINLSTLIICAQEMKYFRNFILVYGILFSFILKFETLSHKAAV